VIGIGVNISQRYTWNSLNCGGRPLQDFCVAPLADVRNDFEVRC
jgi:hypothetical protein